MEFVGHVDPRPYYRVAAIIALVSPSEGFPMVFAEAMAHGIVPICFDSFSAARDLIRNGDNGALIKPFDLDKYAQELVRLARLLDLREFGVRSRRSIERFTAERVIPLWIDALEKVVCV